MGRRNGPSGLRDDDDDDDEYTLGRLMVGYVYLSPSKGNVAPQSGDIPWRHPMDQHIDWVWCLPLAFLSCYLRRNDELLSDAKMCKNFLGSGNHIRIVDLSDYLDDLNSTKDGGAAKCLLHRSLAEEFCLSLFAPQHCVWAGSLQYWTASY